METSQETMEFIQLDSRKFGLASEPEVDTDEGPDLLSRWSTFLYRQKQFDVLEDYQPIWPWIFESEQYLNWKEGRRWQLHCYSEPGCGKTTLAAEAARQLQHQKKRTEGLATDPRDARENERVAVIVLFLSHPNHKEETIYSLADPVTALWRTVMRQILEILLLRGRTREILGLFSVHDLESQDMPLRTLQSRVNAALNRLFDQVFIVVDDLDQCPSTLQADFKVQFDLILKTQRADLVTGIFSIGHFHMPATSQNNESTETGGTKQTDNRDRQRNQNCDVESCEDPERPVLYWRCQTCFAAGIEYDVCQSCYNEGIRCIDPTHVLAEPYDEVPIQLTVSEADMREFVRYKIEDACGKSDLQRRLTDHLKDALESNTVNTASGSLVIARTYVDHLFRSENHEELLSVLDHVAQPEEKYFGTMMHRVKGQEDGKSLLAFQILYLISQASHETRNRRLDYNEILNALAVLNIDFDSTNHKLTLNEMLVICKGILTVSLGDKNLIQAFHTDMEVYLYENQLECFEDFDMDMTELCLETLLANPEVESLNYKDDALRQEFVKQHPFLVYAAQCWGYHLVRNSTDASEENAHALLHDEPRLAASLYIACTNPVDGARVFDIWPGSHPLHVCAFFNLVEQLKLVIAQDPEVDLDVREPVHHRTPLIVACQHGTAGMVKELLNRGARADLLSRTCHSAVYEAVCQGFSHIVQLFVDAEEWSALNQRSQSGRTPLILAVLQPDGGDIVQLLASQDEIDVNLRDDDGRTALMYAIMDDDIDAVDILLQRHDIELHHRDLAGQTAMHIAATAASHEIQRKIFESAGRDSVKEHLDIKDAADLTVLTAMVDLLEIQDDDEESAVEIPQIIEMLIQAGCRVDCTDNVGRGLMHHACMNDSQLPLLDVFHKAGLSPNAGDKQGWTPLHSACAHGASEIAERLLDLGAEPSRTHSPASLLPSDVARLYGYGSLAERMESFEQQCMGETVVTVHSQPLWSRIIKDESDNIESLSEISPNDVLAADPDLQHTALHKAVREHHEPMVRLLLADGRIDINAQSCWNETPLRLAARYSNHSGIVRALLEKGADTAIPDLSETKALALARQKDPTSTNTLLLIEYAKEPIPNGDDMQAMLAAAIRAKNRTVIEALLNAGASMLQHDERALLPVHVAEEVKDDEFLRWVKGKHLDATSVFEKN